MSKVIGIDLGTTNSCVSVMDGKNPKIIENPIINASSKLISNLIEKSLFLLKENVFVKN